MFAVLSTSIWAGPVKSNSELALLPYYCRGTWQIREVSQDPKTLEEYVVIYGHSYYHLHHYCWALNAENQALRASDANARITTLDYALKDIQYTLNGSDPNFVLLPEIYASKARILFKLDRSVEAVGALYKAIEIKSDYTLAYARLADYFVERATKTAL